MKTDARSLWPVLLAFVLLVPPAAAQKTAPAGKTVLQDRVLAVVDEDPVLASDVERAVRLGIEKPQPGESDESFRRRVLNGLIDERLRLHEVDRFNFEQVPVEEIQKRVEEIRASFPDEATFQKTLKDVGIDLKGLRQLVTRQLLVLTYVDERLGARVFVEPDDVSRYYRDVLTPEMKKRGQQPPPLEEVREDIRETLKQQKMTQEMTTWTRELRKKADVVIYPAGGRPLPPVVKTIQGKPQADPKADGGKKPSR